jgi:hypothetical protein
MLETEMARMDHFDPNDPVAVYIREVGQRESSNRIKNKKIIASKIDTPGVRCFYDQT